MSDGKDRAPTEPASPIETPESRMTGEGGPPPEHEEKGPQDGPEYEVTEPADEHQPAPPERG
ncbi:hypothetical protein AB0F71_12670 [Kitasatospora sp. NPDC028055]|uniref:hypothetical protein n=1 Tax=Kitasatospora sp. NPDC028055 TaxID=3155653 RepID=UPI0033DEA86E